MQVILPSILPFFVFFVFLLTAHASVTRFRACLVSCLLETQDRPSLPCRPPSRAGTRARTQEHMICSHWVFTNGPSLSLAPISSERGHQVKSESQWQSSKVCSTYSLAFLAPSQTPQRQFVRLKAASLPQNTNVTTCTCSRTQTHIMLQCANTCVEI